MVALTAGPRERRRERRRPPHHTRWDARAVLRPGVPVQLVDITSHAALVESSSRLRPGAPAEMLLAAGGARTSVRGTLERCYVSALEPLRYRAVVVFSERVDLDPR